MDVFDPMRKGLMDGGRDGGMDGLRGLARFTLRRLAIRRSASSVRGVTSPEEPEGGLSVDILSLSLSESSPLMLVL